MADDKIPLLDSFFDDMPFLTAEKCVKAKVKQAYLDKIVPYKVDTAVFCWIRFPDRFLNIMQDCELVENEQTWISYLWKKKILFVVLNIGAPIAAGIVEELKIFGIKNFIAAGTAGCIVKDFDESKALVITKAIRDEGTSYHYIPASLYVDLNKSMADKISSFLAEKGIKNVQGTTWTTDAFYRETKGRIEKRISQGALAVEMECAALAAVTKFYNLNFGQFVWFSDKVGATDWSWLNTSEDRASLSEKMLLLALEFAKRL